MNHKFDPDYNIMTTPSYSRLAVEDEDEDVQQPQVHKSSYKKALTGLALLVFALLGFNLGQWFTQKQSIPSETPKDDQQMAGKLNVA